ncbi:MAG: FAD:protein FMN transferase [Eubacteriaceae bacterium]
MKKIYYLIILIISMLLFNSCSNNAEELVTKSDFYLDTIVNIKIYDPNKNSELIIDKAFERIQQLEKMLSVHIEGSDLYKIQENAGFKSSVVSDETYYVIGKSCYYSSISQGHFDITAGPLIDLWRIDPPEGYVPSEDELEEVLSKIDYKKIIMDEEKKSIKLLEKGMIANLGAIAKGYIADEVKKVLEENGVEHGIINLGGNVLLVGDKKENTDFKIGVQDPSSNRGEYLGLIHGDDVSIVSSGDYERYFTVDGKRYHHILDPFTGFPADNEIKQVTIISEFSIDGDALSTTTFLLGLEKGLDLINSIKGADAIFITKNNEIHVTSGIVDEFEFDEENFGDVYEVIYPE